MALDERLRRELERAGRPADPSGVYEELIRRRERRRIGRRVQAGTLALVVFAATIGGFFALTRVFRGSEEPPPIAGVALMTDADNTGEAVTAWYGDITLSPRQPW